MVLTFRCWKVPVRGDLGGGHVALSACTPPQSHHTPRQFLPSAEPMTPSDDLRNILVTVAEYHANYEEQIRKAYAAGLRRGAILATEKATQSLVTQVNASVEAELAGVLPRKAPESQPRVRRARTAEE